MLRIDNSSQQSPSLWESVLPPEPFQMNEELTQVDKRLMMNVSSTLFGRGSARPWVGRQPPEDNAPPASRWCGGREIQGALMRLAGVKVKRKR